MLKGFGIIALCLAAEAAFLFHAALPSGIPAGPPPARRRRSCTTRPLPGATRPSPDRWRTRSGWRGAARVPRAGAELTGGDAASAR